MKFYIFAGNRWRRVFADAEDIRVEGKRRPGRLVVLSRDGYLKAQYPQALNHMWIGPPLKEYVFKQPRRLSLKRKFIKRITVKDVSIGTDTEPLVNKNVPYHKSSDNKDRQQQISSDLPVEKTLALSNKENVNGKLLKGKTPSWATLQENSRRHSTDSVETIKLPLKSSDINSREKCDTVEKDDCEQTDLESEDSPCRAKRLTISEEDVAVLRRYIETHKTKIDLNRFESDMAYTAQILYKINPMVRLVRSQTIARMLQDKSKMAVAAFARRLGLHSINDKTTAISNQQQRKKRSSKTIVHRRTSNDSDLSDLFRKRENSNRDSLFDMSADGQSSDDDGVRPKEKRGSWISAPKLLTQQKRTVLAPNKNVIPEKKSLTSMVNQRKHASEEKENTKGVPKFASSKPIKVPRSSSVPPGREYTSKEDHTVIAWLSQSQERERSVSGNRVWRELEEVYEGLTQQRRTWQSLRNRYLRYILPNLEKLALDTRQAQRLRANYATGDLVQKKKVRCKPPHPNSLLVIPTVRSASARRPKSPTWNNIHDKSKETRSAPQRSPDAKTLRPRDYPHHDKAPSRHQKGSEVKEKVTQEKSAQPTKSRRRKRTTSTEDSSDESTESETEKRDTVKRLKRSTRHDSSEPNEGVKRLMRSAGKRVEDAASASSPNYSEITKRFALRHNRSTPRTSNASVKSSPVKTTRQGRRLYTATALT